MNSNDTLSKREYMSIIAYYSSWAIEHKINDENINKADVDKFIAYMDSLNKFDRNMVESALIQYFSYFNDSEFISKIGLDVKKQ